MDFFRRILAQMRAYWAGLSRLRRILLVGVTALVVIALGAFAYLSTPVDYRPLFAGELFPAFGHISLENVRHVTCMNTKPLVVNIEGHSQVRRAGPVTLDNVVIDNLGPHNVYAEYADITLGPGGANFRPDGKTVNLTDDSTGDRKPKQCVFPKLPAPELPEGWLHR